MKSSLQAARDQIIERWIKAFDDYANLNQHNSIIASSRYSKGKAFSLKDYQNGKLPAGQKLLNEFPGKDGVCFKHYFDRKGRVLVTQEFGQKNFVVAAGYYSWQQDSLEYIEFNLSSRLPSAVQKISFKNGLNQLFQSVHLNSGGHYPGVENISRNELIESILGDDYSMIFNIEEYKVKNHRIDLSFGYSKMGREISTENKYEYDSEGILQKIRTLYDSGGSFISYAKPSGKSLKKLAGELSVQMASYLINCLSSYSFGSPLFSVELGYQYCYTYWPCLGIITQDQKEEALQKKETLLFLSNKFINTNPDQHPIPNDLSELFSEFVALMESKDNWQVGREMLWQTARIMTDTKLNGTIRVTEDFIAFPIEWSIDDWELEKILFKCGAGKQQIKEWKKAGWIPKQN